MYPGWHLHLFGPTHSPCLHPGWHIAANRGILIIFPLQSQLTVLYFKINSNYLTNNSAMFLPSATLYASLLNIRCTFKNHHHPNTCGKREISASSLFLYNNTRCCLWDTKPFSYLTSKQPLCLHLLYACMYYD